MTHRAFGATFVSLVLAVSACGPTLTPAPTPSGTPAALPTPTSSPPVVVATPGPTPTPIPPPGDPTFSVSILRVPRGASEPGLAISDQGTAIIMAGTWKRTRVSDWSTRFWRAEAGEAPVAIGSIDRLAAGSLTALSSHDVDLEIAPDGVLHATTNMRFFDDPAHPDIARSERVVAAFRCPGVDDVTFSPDRCSGTVIRRGGADRPWITLQGETSWILLASPNSTNYVMRSTDDGRTWGLRGRQVPGGAAGPFDAYHGPLVVNPATGRLTFALTTDLSGHGHQNDLLVARSDDEGRTWQTAAVAHARSTTYYGSVFPTIALDASTGTLYLAWSDEHHVFESISRDGGETWSPRMIVSSKPVASAVQPTIVASAGRVDIAYLGTSGSGVGKTTNDWNLYLSRSLDGGTTFRQSVVSAHVHRGAICWVSGCTNATLTMLELFEIAIDPSTGKLRIAFVNDTTDRDSAGRPLPQIGYAAED